MFHQREPKMKAQPIQLYKNTNKANIAIVIGGPGPL